MDRRVSQPGYSADVSGRSEHSLSTTTISTVAVQAGRAKIVLAILKSNDWIRVRIQQMEPDLMEVGSTLDEALALRHEHDDLLTKLNMKQKDVADLLARADDLTTQNRTYQEVYEAMAQSLGEAWKDLNRQLEYRKMLLDQSIAFHQSALKFSEKMELAQNRFSQIGLANDVDTARHFLQQHQELKKSILESSMSTLQEGQLLLERIREMGIHADVQNRHATTAACYGIEHLLELLQDRRRHLEELWLQRKVKLEQCLQLLLLDEEVKKVFDWYDQVGDGYLKHSQLGDNLHAAQMLQEEHVRFEMQARDMQETVLRLIRTADQLVHSDHYNAESVKERLKTVDQKSENFMVALDNRRRNLSLAVTFFLLAKTALTKLDEIERQLTSTDLPRNSSALADLHAYMSGAIVEVTAPALREGRTLLERVGRAGPGAKGVSSTVDELQEWSTRLENMCMARYEAGEQSRAYNEFKDRYNTVHTWLTQIGQVTLNHYNNMGRNLSTARDFQEIHERLVGDIKDKMGDVESLVTMAKQLAKDSNPQAESAVELAKQLQDQWNVLHALTQKRISVAQTYVTFHKRAQEVAIQMDALEQYLKIEKVDPTQITDSSVQHKERKYSEMDQGVKDVETKGKRFITDVKQVEDTLLDTRHAVSVVETIISQFSERKYLITEYHEHWKVHISTGKEFLAQWHQFVQDARKTIDWVMRIETEFFPVIGAELGSSAATVKHYQKQLDDFIPNVKKAQLEIETHLKTAELLSLKGDTKGEKEQIVNELLKVHTRFQARITEYQLLLNMTIKFFEHLKQLDKLIENTEQEYEGTELPSEVTHAQVMLREHEANHERINQLIGLSHNEGEQIVVRVRQKDSETHAKDGVQNVLEMTDVRRMTWERAWETQKNRLEQNVQVCQFYFDLRQIHGELDELQRQLDARQGHYGHSLSSITMTSEAFKNFEATVELIEGKIKTFVSTAEMMVRDHTHDSQRIRQEVDEVEKKWSRFYTSIHDYRAALDSSTKFFVMMDKCDASVTEAGQFLLQIGRKATDCKTSEDTTNLIQSLELYRTQFAREQDEKLSEMSRIAISIFGPQQGPQRLQHTVDSNTDVISSINRAIEEVAILKANLIKKEQILDQMNKVAETAKTRFIQPLENAEINEGQKFTFQCRLPSDTPEPKIEWFKDNMPLTSPDYQTSYTDGTCTLTIEETFSEDTAKYTCKATTDASTIESSANLTVRELAHQKVVPPDFSKHLKSQDIPEGSQLTLECHTTGIPCPSISWLKDDTNIDNSPDYVITKINGTCCLKVRKVLPEHAGRYTCKATNPGGEASSSARLNVISVKKPYFHEPLKNMTVKESESVKLECHFSAEPAPQIQWLKNDAPIQSSPAFRIIIESTFTSLTIREVYAANAGTYSVVARNLGGEARTSCTLDTTSSIAARKAPPAMQPRIMQPLQNKDAMEGSSARLDCVIVGQPEPEVIWFHNEQPVKESEDFQLLFEGDRCSLVIREVYLEDSGEYKCVARNKHGVNESKCRLMVEPLSELSDASASGLAADSVAPKFTQLLKDIETPEGSRVRFDCRVIGHPTPNVKWYRGPNEITNSTDFQMTSERELHSLAIPEAFCEDSGNYMVKATNLAGQAKCYAALVVKPLVETTETKMKLVETTQRTVAEQKAVVAGQPPEFKKLFKDMKVRPGDRCQFEVVISGNPRPKVTWLFNAEPVVSPDYQIKSVGDTSILCIPEVFDEDAGRFSVTAENSSGKATCSALLTVEEDTSAVDSAPELLPKPVAPPVAHKPQVYKPEVVKAVAVAPVATTLAPAQVQPPAPSPTYQTQLKQPVTPQFQPVDVTIQLPVPPKFIEKLKNIAAQEGTRVTFQGCVKGKPQPTIRWYKEGKELTDSADFEISYQNGRVSMTIPEVFEEDAGKYACAAENSAGAATSTAELIVKASVNVPEFIDRLQSLEVKEGDPIKFTIRVTGNARVTWYREGSQIVSSPDFEISQQGDYHSLYIPEVFYEDSGKFSVKAENSAGQTMCTAELIVEAPSAIDESASPSPMSRSPSIGARSPIMPQGSSREATPQQPQKPQFTKPLQNRAVREGDRVVLECVVPPYPAPESVQWACNDVPINDSPDYSVAYNNGRCTLTIVEVFPEDSGTFSCTIIVNGVNNVTTMYLRVEAMPPVSPRPVDSSPIFDLKMANQPLSHGQTAYFECKVRAYPPPEILWTRRGHPLVDKARYKSTYDQYSGMTTLTILSLRDEDEGEYTCTAINPLGETSTSATLMAPDRYQAWLRGNQPVALVPAPAPAPPAVPQKSAMTAELQQLQQQPTSPGRATFYRPMSERLLDKTTERRLSDLEVDKPREPFKVSAFEKRLVKEIELREGKYQPPMPASDTEAFEESVPLMQCKPPKFEQKLSNFQLMEGSDATFVCKVSGNPKPKVEWYHEGRLIRKSNRYEMKVTRDGYASLRIRVAFPEDAGHYTCCATNLVGRDACSAELFVEEVGTIDDTSYVAPNTLRKMMRSPSGSRRGSRDFGGVSEKHFRPKFRKIPVDRDAQEGQMTRFDCVVSGRPIPELLWFRDGIQVHDDQLHKIVVNEDGIHSLIIHAVQPYDTGHYTAIARNKAGEDTCQVSLNVQRRNTMCAPRFIQRLKNTTVREHDTVQLEADCEGVPVPMMSWQKDSRMIPVNDEHYRIETNEGRSTLYINDASPFDSAWYQCTAASRAGTATNRMRLIVQAEPQPPTPERKLVIPKKKTPTPTKEAPPIPTRPEPTPMRVSTPIELSKPAQPRAPSIPSTAEILISPVPQPAGAAAVPWRHVAPPQAREPQGVGQAPQPPWKPPQATQAKLDLAKPRPPVMKKPTVCLAAPTSMSKPSTDTIDYEARVKSQPPIQRPPMQELIETGIEPEPDAGDMFIKETPRPPKFKTHIRPQTRLVESQPAHFECKLTPIGDPNMRVEWYKNGELLRAGHRFRTVYDFGFAALDILYTYHEDNGMYMCKATNNHGSDSTEAPLSCRAKESVITDSQLPPGSGSVQQIEAMEEAVIRGADQAPRPEELEEPCPPVFDLMPEPIQVEEGEPAKFMVKVNGHPRPRLTWWVNGAMVVNGPRFILTFDGMIHTMEIPKVREYDSGNIRVVCKNPMGEAECSTTLLVIPQEDWRSRLKQAPKPAVEVELERHRHVSLQSMELQHAFMKPKTTVVEIRAMERAAQEKALSYKDEEVTNATHMINLQHTQMSQVDASRELRKHDPTVRTETDQHKERARAMLRMEASETNVTHVQRTKRKCAEPPTFVEPLKNVTVKEGFAVKLEVKYTGTPTPVIQWFREGVEIQPSRDFQISIFMNKSYLFIPEVFPEDAGTFSVQAINEFGLVECRAVLIVEEDKVKELKEMHPEFRVQMHDIRIKLGEPATFDCQVCGHPKAEMYWLKNGKRMPESSRWKFIVEEDHYTLLIYETSVEDEGLYECVAVNKMGKATCCARLVVQGKPIKGLPQQQIVGAFMAPQLVEPLRDQEVREGVPAVFECKISATPDPVVQWYYNNQMVKPSKYFQMQSNRGVHRLTITGAFPEDEGTYKCIARNQSGEVTCIAHLTVIPLVSRPQVSPQPLKVMEPPSFSQPITGIDVAEGNPTQFEAIVAGQPLPQVSWFREGVQIPHSDEFQIILEGNRCILRIKSVFPEDAGIFTCRATNPAGVAESSAELFVEMKQRVSKGSIELAQQPQIMKKAPQVLKAPSPVREVVTGSTTKLVVQLEAYPLPRFNWYRNGRQINPSQRIKISYENGVITLVIFNVQPADSGKYELRATNDMGEIVCTTTLDIKPKQKVMELPSTTHEVTLTSQKPMTQAKPEVTPVFVQPLKPEVRIRENTTARLECQVQAFPVPTISWHINGIEIKPSPKYTVRLERNKSVLLINNVQVADSGVYTCRAVSEVGEAISSTTLYVTVVEHEMEPPKFSQPLEPVTAIDGTEVTLSCNVRGRPVPDVSWFHNDKNIDDSDDFVITYNRSSGKTDLVIVDCLPDDQGIFKCVAKNNAGQAVTQCRLTVTSATKVSEVKGEITVTDVSTSEAEVTIVKRVVKRQSGQPPRFATPIQPQVVRDNETVRFNAVVMGAPVPDITWLKDKVEVKPSDRHQMIFDKDTLSCSLIITNASTVDVGVYSCRANNPAGKATCTANVVVVPPGSEVTTVKVSEEVRESPSFVEPLKPLTVNDGEQVTLTCVVKGRPSPTITWFRNDTGVDKNDDYIIKFDDSTGRCELIIVECFTEDSGVFRCVATNDLGETSTCAELIVNAVSVSESLISEEDMTSETLDLDVSTDAITMELDTTDDVTSHEFVMALPQEGELKMEETTLVIEPTEETFTMAVGEPLEASELTISTDVDTDSAITEEFTLARTGEEHTEEFTFSGETTSATEEVHMELPEQDFTMVTDTTAGAELTEEFTFSGSEATSTEFAMEVVQDDTAAVTYLEPIKPQVVEEGKDATFVAKVTGKPEEVTWYKDLNMLEATERLRMDFDANTGVVSLTIVKAIPEDFGNYSLEASNSAGKARCTANLVVVPPDAEVTITEKTVSVKKEKITVIGQQETHVVENSPTFSQPLLPHTEVTEGENVTLQCQAVAEPEPTFTWYRSGMDITPTKRTHVISDKGTSTLTIENVTLEDAGQYVCTSRNALGESHTKTMLHIKRVTRDQQEETVDVVLEPVDLSAQPMQSTPIQQAPPSEEPQRQQQPPSQPPVQTTSRFTHEQTFLQQQEMYYAAPPLEEPPQFMMPLRDQSVSDGDEVVFRVLFRGSPAPTITWFFNSQPIKNSADFQLMIDAEKGESKLVIVEVFPDDEGEYMCRAENSMGTAVTHCHLFVKLPSSSEEDEAEKIVTKTTEVVKAQEPLTIREMRRFSETIEIEPKEKQQPMELQFGIPKRPSLTSELTIKQPSVPWGMRMHVEVPAPMYSERRSLQLKQRAEALATQRQELQMAITKQRRFSETIAIDLAKKPREVQLQFKLPERSAVTVHRRSAPRGVKMEVDVPRQRTSSIDRPQRAQAIETQRHEVTMSLEGGAPKFVVELLPKKVMDGEEVKLNGRVVGNPMPEVTWYHNGKAILDNPDFRMTYDQRTGEVELHIMEVFPQDTGTYECVASNKYGQAVVKTTVIVEVYEYVPDSEEATASQTESMISTSSMDEAEFQQKTQRFLANMEILRKEIHEDVIPVREFKEETIDELEIEERGYEETIQMADVKWQIQKHSDEVEERVSEESHEPVPDVTTEQLLEGGIPSETVLAAVDIAESHVQPQEAKADEELTTEFVAEGTDVTQHEEIEVELAHHVVQLQPETRVETMKEDRAAEYAENITAEASETTKEEETSVEFVQYSVSDKQETMTQPQVDTSSEEVTLVMEATSEEMTTEQQITIDLSQPMVEEKVESQVDVVKEDLPDEAVIEISLSEGENLQEEEITVDLTQPSVEGKRESMVGLQEEIMPVESLSEITLPAQDVPSEEAITYDMAQPSVEQRHESRVDVLEEKLPEEVLADVAAPSEDVAAEEEITVEVSSHTVELPQETRVDKVEESLPVEGSEELPVPSEEITKEEETTVEMAQPSLDERRESRVDITAQASVDETASDITETSQQTVMEQDIVMTLSESQLVPQDESRTDYVEEKQEMEEEETFVDVPEAMSEGEEIFVELAAIDDKEQQESMVQPSEEILPEEGSADITQPSEEMTKEEETIVELAVPSVQPQEESRVEIVVEAPLEEHSADISLPSEEIAAEEEIKVDISQPHVEGKVESRTEVVEDITVEESSMEITLTSEETTKEVDITVEMAQPSQEPKQETMVETMEEIIAEEGTAEISLTTEETVSEEEVTLDLAKSSVEGKPETQVTIVDEMQPEELATEVLPTVEDQPSEKAVSVELAQPSVEDKPETQVTTVEEMQQEELATELMPTVEDKPSEEAVTVELAQPLVEDKPETQVTIVEEMQTEELATEVLPTVEDQPSEEAVSVKMAQPSVEDKQETMVVPVDEHQAIESAADIDVTAEETTKQEDTEVDLAQSTVEAPLESRTDIQDETLAEDVLGEVTLPAEEGTQEEETSVELSQLSEMDIKESHVDVQVESIAAEAADEIVVEVTTEMAQSQEVSVDMEQTEVKQTAESMVEIQMSTETAETMIELGEQIPSSETAGSAEIIVDLSVSSIEIEQSHVDFTDERHSEEREEDIFEDVPEALPESKEIVTDLTAIEGRLQPEVLVETQETRTDLELTQDIQIETTEHVSDEEEIFYELEQAEEEVPRPSQVDIQEAVADVQSAEKLVTEGEDVSEESKVEVSLEVAEMEPAKPSLTQTQQTELEIQLTGDDVDSYMEERTVSEDISVEMSSVEMTKKTEMYTEQVKVGEKTEEISDLVSHEVLPAQPELTAEVELMAADMAQQIVQALQEETEQTMLSTEVITEDVSQQIATTEVTEQTEQLTEQVTATTMMAPAFNIPLSDVTVIDGEKALLECHVSGIPRPEVTWSVDGQDIKPSADFIITYEASVCVLQILDVLPEDEGEYSVTAVNEAGTCSSTAYLTVLPPSGPESEADSVEREKRTMAETMAELETVSMEEMTSTSTQLDVTLESTSESFVTEVKVPEAPRFTRKLENKEIFETLPIQLECDVIGHPEPEVTWYQDGKKMTSTDHALIAYTDGLCSLSIDKVTLEDEAEYMCEARNEAGVATTWAELLVEKLISAVEQVILEEYYEIEIEMHFKWNLPPDLPELPVSEPDQDSIDTDAA